MEYQVPQFIEVEDKVVGPLTIKQFIYVAGGAGLCAIAFYFLPFIFAALVALPVGGLAGTLAFYKVNGKSFAQVLESAFGYYTGAKLFLWKHEDAAPKRPNANIKPGDTPPLAHTGARLTRGKLSQLAWTLDIQSQQGDTSSR